MLIPLAGFAVVLLVALVLALTMGSRRAAQLSELKNKNEELGQLLSAHKTRFDEKCKQIDEFRSKLDRVRDEAKRAKKRIYDLEHATDQVEQNDDTARAQEEALLEAKAENKAAKEKIAQFEEHKAHSESQVEKLKSELVTLRRDLDDKNDELEKVKGGKTGEVAELKKQETKAPGQTGCGQSALQNRCAGLSGDQQQVGIGDGKNWRLGVSSGTDGQIG